MLRFGNITEVNPQNGYARVTFLDDGVVSAELQMLTRAALVDKDSYTFEINEQVAVLMDENSEVGVILGAVFNNNTKPDGGGPGIFRVKFSDESVVEYNRATHEYNINIKGKVNITAYQVNIEATTAVLNADTVEVTATSVTVDADETLITSPVINVQGVATLDGALTVTGTVTAASISASSISGPGMTMEGGNLVADGSIEGATVKAGTIDLATHVHAGVTTGGGSTAVPTP